jgi:hypothetical protein
MPRYVTPAEARTGDFIDSWFNRSAFERDARVMMKALRKAAPRRELVYTVIRVDGHWPQYQAYLLP